MAGGRSGGASGGNNTMAGPISLTANGGNGWLIHATAGHLLVSGPMTPLTSSQTSQSASRPLWLIGSAPAVSPSGAIDFVDTQATSAEMIPDHNKTEATEVALPTEIRSAGWQPAVAQVFNRRNRRTVSGALGVRAVCRLPAGASAGLKPARRRTSGSTSALGLKNQAAAG